MADNSDEASFKPFWALVTEASSKPTGDHLYSVLRMDKSAAFLVHPDTQLSYIAFKPTLATNASQRSNGAPSCNVTFMMRSTKAGITDMFYLAQHHAQLTCPSNEDGLNLKVSTAYDVLFEGAVTSVGRFDAESKTAWFDTSVPGPLEGDPSVREFVLEVTSEPLPTPEDEDPLPDLSLSGP